MSLYRNTVWFMKGLREYTRSGYEAAAQHFGAKDLDVDVTGRCFLITGANSGIGKAAALEIAMRGGTVHLVCRNKERAEEAKAEIVKASNNKEVFVHILDMSRPTMIWTFADEFQQTHSKLNVLINNAGCMINQRQMTADQLESNFATNTLGVYILTTALVPLLQKSEDARVITVSSGGMLVQKLNVEDLQFEEGQFDGTMAYAQNKRQQVIMTEQWTKMHKNIHFSSMHPGWADTPDRKPVSTHLFLAQTRATAAEEEKLMKTLEELAENFKPETRETEGAGNLEQQTQHAGGTGGQEAPIEENEQLTISG